jgi:hypothetical protein
MFGVPVWAQALLILRNCGGESSGEREGADRFHFEADRRRSIIGAPAEKLDQRMSVYEEPRLTGI